MTGPKPARGIFWGILFSLLTWLVILTPRGGFARARRGKSTGQRVRTYPT
jgi:hypothetical protein